MSMARNLAEGSFGFWDLHFSNTFFNHFYEHPPLGVYLMSLLFLVFGDTILIDKFFGVFFGLLIMVEIAAIYRLVSSSNSQNGMLLGVFYFIAFPMSQYTLENNFLEIPATFFILAAVYIFFKGALSKHNKIVYPLFFATMLLAAFLVKGPVTLFPLALPFFYFLLFSKEYTLQKMFFFYAWMLAFICFFCTALYIYEPSNHYLSFYFNNQILASINGSRGGDKHFELLSQLIFDFGAIFLASVLIIIAGRIRPLKLTFSPLFWLFILIGLSASVPLEISPRQHNYYIFPSLAFFAIALSLLFVNPISKVIKKWGGYKLIKVFNILLVLALIGVAWQKFYDYRRHKNFHNDFVEADVPLEKNAHIKICVDNPEDRYKFFSSIEITGNLERYYEAQLFEGNTTMPYYLTTKDSLENCQADLQYYHYIGPDKPNYYLLYQHKTSALIH